MDPVTCAPALRRLDAGDLGGIAAHLLDLDMVSRNQRFHCGFGDAAITAYVDGLDAKTDILFGAIDPRSDQIVGLVEARATTAQHTVDLGVSVLPSHRGLGLGRKLVAQAAETAFAEGNDAVDLRFDPANLPASRIVAGLGARVRMPGHAVLYDRAGSALMRQRSV